MKKITAVVVTYNRFQLLQKVISCLKNQTRPLDSIIVINNNSTDGTKAWLDEQSDLTVIHQDNVGGAGGFARGIKEAYSRGFDYIWAMDDDVNPTLDCLENLLKYSDSETGILCPKRIMDGNKIILGETLRFNFANPFKHYKTYLSLNDITGKQCVEIQGMAFEGPLIKREVVEKIGLPNAGLFIFFDDTDYSYRAYLSGFKVKYVNDAILNKENLLNLDTPFPSERSWKVQYGLRNQIWLCHKYAKSRTFKCLYPFFILMNYLLGYIKHMIKHDGYYKSSDLKMFFCCYNDALNNNLGKY